MKIWLKTKEKRDNDKIFNLKKMMWKNKEVGCKIERKYV